MAGIETVREQNLPNASNMTPNMQAVGTQKVSNAQMASDEGQCVVFQLSGEEFAIDINNVKEIVRLPNITPIPRSPQFVSGICNLRGSVLPVIDTRIRFSMKPQEVTDQTRLLVVESSGVQTSLLVDNVREVLRIRETAIEPPPAVCKGVEREFLTGVVKINKGERLIMMLNLNELIAVDLSKTASKQVTAGSVKSDSDKSKSDSVSEEEQLVSFRVADDEYAFDIAKVSEILKVSRISAVPNVPDYVLGLFTIRNHLLPILDMRRLLGLPTLISERQEMLEQAVESENRWAEDILNSLESGKKFSGTFDSKKTTFGIWLESYNTSSVELELVAKRLKRERTELYSVGKKLMESAISSNKGAIDSEVVSNADALQIREQFNALSKGVSSTIKEFKEKMAAHIREDQRTMVVECESMTIGFLVDWVDEVLRIPKSVIDKTPAMAASRKKEIKSVAKLDSGDRLIMIMDESALVSEETREMLSDIKSGSGNELKTGKSEGKSISQQSIDEEQMVTFSINNEEYGIRIMQVQEINRISEITHIPRAPHFIDGMTNLRGNVIPVINVRRLFDLEEKEVDDRTRIIIVDIGGTKTGLRVDQVNEVLRLSKHDIEETPSIVTEDSTSRLMQGICKINDGKRMIVLLDVSEILDQKELKHLKQMAKSESGGSEKKAGVEDKTTLAKASGKKLAIAE
ncbi:MAG: chemotaxis protein CheW [Desulfamplus sp.]|nr:chemotaxis protein CheW [Desulfamplus sp.]